MWALLLELVSWLTYIEPRESWQLQQQRDHQFWYNTSNSPHARKLFGEDK